MALFGIDREPAEACRAALAGARAMALALDELNRELAHDLREPLRIGIGLHAGPVILGEMGYRRATSLTAIGDPVNVASRLEALTKELGAQLVVSAALAERAGVDLAASSCARSRSAAAGGRCGSAWSRTPRSLPVGRPSAPRPAHAGRPPPRLRSGVVIGAALDYARRG